MKKRDIFPAWIRILQGYKPFLSIEVTKECPLHCPGCYAYNENHLDNGRIPGQIYGHRGDALIAGILKLVRRYRPLHLSIVGGEPLLVQREMTALLERPEIRSLEIQFITSAVTPIPACWSEHPNLHLVVSVDGLQQEHDLRRTPATYEKILTHIKGQKIIVHCTVLRPMLERAGYLRDFAEIWSGRPETRKIWFSLYTPQKYEQSRERLTAQERKMAIEAIARVSRDFPLVYAPRIIREGYHRPPSSSLDCIFARTTVCISPDLETEITPCQLGGNPSCEECGCIASAGLVSLGRLRIAGLISLSTILKFSQWIGNKAHPHTPRMRTFTEDLNEKSKELRSEELP